MLHAATCPAQLCQVCTHCVIRVAPAVDELSKISAGHMDAKAKAYSADLVAVRLNLAGSGVSRLLLHSSGIASVRPIAAAAGRVKAADCLVYAWQQARLCTTHIQIAIHLIDK